MDSLQRLLIQTDLKVLRQDQRWGILFLPIFILPIFSTFESGDSVDYFFQLFFVGILIASFITFWRFAWANHYLRFISCLPVERKAVFLTKLHTYVRVMLLQSLVIAFLFLFGCLLGHTTKYISYIFLIVSWFFLAGGIMAGIFVPAIVPADDHLGPKQFIPVMLTFVAFAGGALINIGLQVALGSRTSANWITFPFFLAVGSYLYFLAYKRFEEVDIA